MIHVGWEFPNKEILLQLFTGSTYSSIDEAFESKKFTANYVNEKLELTPDSTVLDLGCGPGHIAFHVSDNVAHLYCADISESFLEVAKETLKEKQNVSFLKIKHGVLSPLRELDAIYCLAVMIHFNIYDIVIYLTEMHRILKHNGKILLDFYDSEFFDPNDKVFKKHCFFYKIKKEVLLTAINFNSMVAFKSICDSIGFECEVLISGKNPMILLKKL